MLTSLLFRPSIPALLSPENITQGNSVINLVSSFSSLIGPVIGGTLFGFFGIMPILYISVVCFLASAIMEIFIHIPFEKKETHGSIFSIGFHDLKDSFHYMRREEPLIIKISLIIAAINLFLSSLMIIGLPIMVTQILTFDPDTAIRLYGYAEGFIAAGSLAGGILAGVMSKKLKAKNSYKSIIYCALTLIPIGLAIAVPMNPVISYIILVISCFVMMLFASLFSVQMMAYLQMIVPGEMLGKVISCAMCIGMCASPLGQAIYGGLFQIFASNMYIVIFASAMITCLISILSKKTFKQMSVILEKFKI